MRASKKNILLMLGIFVAMLAFQAVFSICVSPLYEFSGVDSAIYEYMGYAWYLGKMPYYDVFEGKGPLLFLINAIGWAIDEHGLGIFLLQCLNYTFVTMMWLKIARLFATGWRAVMAVVLTLAIYLLLNEEGNLTEDWCMLPISYSMYLLVRMVRDDIIPSRWEYALAGFGAGFVTMIRVNNMPLTVLLALYTVVYLCSRRQYAEVWKSGLSMFGGFLLPIVGFVAYFFIRWGLLGLQWLYFGTIGFNLDYAANHDASVAPMLVRVVYWSSVGIFLYMGRKTLLSDRRYLVLYLLACSLSYAVLGKSLYVHYFMIMLPIAVYVASMAWEAHSRLIWVMLVAVLAGDVCVAVSNMQYLDGNGRYYPKDFNPESDQLVAQIPEEDRDSVFNYDDEFTQVAILKRNSVMQCNRSLGTLPNRVSERYDKETHNQLYELQPKWLISSRPWSSLRDSIYVANHYEMVYETNYDLSDEYMFCQGQVRLYRRIDSVEHDNSVN